MRNADQFACPAVYLVVGLAAWHLDNTDNFRKWQRNEVIVKSRHSEMIQGLTGLLTTLAVRDAATVTHCRRAASLAGRVGARIELDRDTLNDLRLAALVHDIAKTGMPDDVLFKDGQLSDTETTLMHRHVDVVVSMLRAIPDTESIARLVAQHHECPEGAGYPSRLRQDATEPAANVLRVADAFAALTEARPCHEALTPAGAIGIMFGMAETKIDSAAFLELCGVIEDSQGQLSLDDSDAPFVSVGEMS